MEAHQAAASSRLGECSLSPRAGVRIAKPGAVRLDEERSSELRHSRRPLRHGEAVVSGAAPETPAARPFQ
jgi:hypothetical protein